ncbi:BLOC-1-related complex subunit 5-like [Ostrea edulis]|uniref:BLOC-1-related complex subunit 5-like n=1 Tax=Ostrea edulis TaxID=37623 RepID=UPI00209636AC|nr:BLOC-1-related complex subunit 5-like [Ostrea edulis]XP_048765145.1 BLOC-1-related complex subunit 5-like [Ostrea edulis]XP_048765146.1 BLOC-1-related complex subunit 5-like [Ostrea edulis]XP_048765149.1 BLOC-1-related complex subunit 5-like [Ostrea edulis]XP_056015596.1 BLOC-1-related complex subunit 5-like [Ostrea edulis]XP_056015597.1 BLOC-1-related complex subunit 5-like [Ostrea edulis]XP_056015598.1 BLOC-1-related complex subunit 5-like [Ostrea edulis]
MGADQSTQQLPAGAPGSSLRSQRDEDIPYTSFAISKPIDSNSPRLSPRTVQSSTMKSRPPNPKDREPKESGPPKHDIVVVTDGNVIEKDPDPELTKMNTIPVFYPIMRGSLNIPTSSRDLDLLDKMGHEQLLFLCVRYQEHLKQLAESVAFDQNALCVRIKEIDCAIQLLLGVMQDKQKKYHKHADQFQRISETLSILNRVKDNMQSLVPKMEHLNEMLPADRRLEPLNLKSQLLERDCDEELGNQ